MPSQQEIARAAAVKKLDLELAERLLKFCRLRFGRDWAELALEVYSGSGEPADEVEFQIAMPWALFHCPSPARGIVPARAYQTDAPPRFGRLLEANLDAWISLWEVTDVERGVGASITDLLTGAERFVYEVLATETMEARTVFLARLVDVDGISFMGGVHPQALSPLDADVAVRAAKKLCGVRTRPVKIEKLQDPDVQLRLIHEWRGAVEARMRKPLPVFTNTDGDLMEPMSDHFEITGARDSIIARLASFPGATEPRSSEEREGILTIEIVRPDKARGPEGGTITGHITIAASRMKVETNSLRRADTLRDQLVAHLGGLVRYKLREETSIEDLMRRAMSNVESGRESGLRQSPEEAAIALDFRERHMTEWLDTEIPALGGITPREAAKHPGSARRLDVLLREFELHEGRLPENERLDIERLRVALGMSTGKQ